MKRCRELLIILFSLFPIILCADGQIYLNGTAGEALGQCKVVSLFSAYDPTVLTSSNVYKLLSTVGSPWDTDGIVTQDWANSAEIFILLDGIISCTAPGGGVTKGATIYAKHSDSTLSTSSVSAEAVGEAVTTAAAGDSFDLYFHPNSMGGGGGGSGTVTSVAGGVGITNSPEPITTTGTVDMDIHSLTANTVATGDEIACQDVSVGNTPADQRRTTAGAIASLSDAPLLDGSHNTDTTNSAVTRGDIIYGNSTPAWDDLAIGAAGKVLTSDGTDVSWQRPVRYSPCDESVEQCFFDDFNNQSDDNSTGTVTIANIGEWKANWSGTLARVKTISGGNTIAGGGTGIMSSSLQLDTGSSTGGEGCVLRSCGSALGAGNTLNSTPRGKSAIRFSFHTGDTLSSVSDRYYFIIGMNNSGSCNNTDTSGSVNMELVYSDAVSTKFQAIAKTAAGTSTCDTTVTVNTNTDYKGCMVTSADSCTLDVYLETTASNLDCRDPDNITGTPKCTITGNNIPGCNSAGGVSGLTCYIDLNKTAGTNARQWYVDYYGWYQRSDTAR